MQSDSLLSGASRVRRCWRKMLTKSRRSLMSALFLPAPWESSQPSVGTLTPLYNKPGLRVEGLSRCYLGTFGVNIHICLIRHPVHWWDWQEVGDPRKVRTQIFFHFGGKVCVASLRFPWPGWPCMFAEETSAQNIIIYHASSHIK